MVRQELERLGLQEGQDVAAKDFRAIAMNRVPGSGERLTVRDAANRKPGYEFHVAPPRASAACGHRPGMNASPRR